ncbi:hypothetical protein [Leptospira kmetyi]|uniref:hypothetical protein n=1 Tax=Leptospira kmetyi TaxID=408139 RepID=UPI000C2AC7A5|nr:hypothetical protein [Leptospira kmetyi]
MGIYKTKGPFDPAILRDTANKRAELLGHELFHTAQYRDRVLDSGMYLRLGADFAHAALTKFGSWVGSAFGGEYNYGDTELTKLVYKGTSSDKTKDILRNMSAQELLNNANAWNINGERVYLEELANAMGRKYENIYSLHQKGYWK